MFRDGDKIGVTVSDEYWELSDVKLNDIMGYITKSQTFDEIQEVDTLTITTLLP